MAKPKICIISLTPVTDEPRVLRQASALYQDGWDITVAGYSGRQAPPPFWRFIPVQHVKPIEDFAFEPLLSELKHRLARWSEQAAEDYYWRLAGYDGIYEHIAVVEGMKCDLAVAHDYFTAPIAARLAGRNGGKYAIDCHEYAREQYVHDPKWVRREQPWIDQLQARFLPKAAVVTTICDGIADLLTHDYKLARRPVVTRSASAYRESTFKPTGDKIEVLYHGNIFPTRGLEPTIISVSRWRSEFRFVIRGPGEKDYIDQLRALAAEHGVSDRVAFDPPILFNDLVPIANRSDVGLFVQEDCSAQKQFTLPNKFFEYVMAGLTLCVSDLPEMANLVRQYNMGITVSQPETNWTELQ